MKTKLLIFTIFLGFLSVKTFSQNKQVYNAFFNEGKAKYSQGNYLVALQKFDQAVIYAVNQTQKDNANNYRTKCITAAQQQQIDLQKALKDAQIAKLRDDSALKVVEIQKQRADSALTAAKLMQLKVEIAMFDKAVKEQNKENSETSEICVNFYCR